MANIYVDSAAGSNTSPYSTWATAAATVALGIAVMVAGDTMYVANTHAESSASALSWTFPGTQTAPNRVICTDKTNTPPLSSDLVPASGSLTAGGGGTVTTTGASGITFGGGCVYVRGITFNVGTGTTGANLTLGSNTMVPFVFENCQFNLLTTAVSTLINTTMRGQITWNNCTVSFGNVSQKINNGALTGFRWQGAGSKITGTIFPTILIADPGTAGSGGWSDFDSVDFSAMGSGKTIVNLASGGQSLHTLRNCKLGAAVTVAGFALTAMQGRVFLINCDTSGTQTRNELWDAHGTLTTELTDIRSGGAADLFGNPYAWAITTTTLCNTQIPFDCYDISFPILSAQVGSLRTVTIAIMSNATLTNADIWPEVTYLGSGSPQGLMASGGLADPLAANNGGWPLDPGSTWVTTGVSGPVQQRMAVSFTPQLAGLHRVRVRIAKTSQTLRVDPLPQVA